MKNLKNWTKCLLNTKYFATNSYSQEGEDLIVQRILGVKKGGFYVDVGCHHPYRFSNTYLFYKLGWSGICIDPLPGTVKLFEKWRPRDTALEVGISSKQDTLDYYMFNDPALNTFDKELAEERGALPDYRVTEVRTIQTLTLAEILDQHLPTIVKEIDFLTIDAEGLDLEILRSNNWAKYSPTIVVAECLNENLLTLEQNPICKLMLTAGYIPCGKSGHSVVFIKR
jgi:FkbM family methyltransferase